MQTHALISSADPETFVSVGQAAALLGVHPDTVRRWEKAGRIRSLRTPTGHRRFRRDDVDAMLVPVHQSAS